MQQTYKQRNRTNRRRARFNSGVTMSGTPAIQPVTNTFQPAFIRDSYNAKLRYGQASINLTATTASVGTYVFSANGLFDPSVTGGALQPAGFAQLMLSYNHYVVWRSRISVIVTNNGTTPQIFGLSVNGDVTSTSDPSNLLELPREQLVDLNPASADGSTKTLKMACNIAKFSGIDDIRDNSVYRGNSISNPTEQVYYMLSVFATKGGTSDVYMNVVIEYDAYFNEPRTLAPSFFEPLMKLLREQDRQKEKPEEKVFVCVSK